MKRRTLTLGTLITLLVALTAGTAYAHFLAFSAVDDQGTDEVMHFAVDPSAASIQGKVDNATVGADSWDKLDCFYDSACSGVNWVETTVADAKSRDNSLVIFAEPVSDSPTHYGQYYHRDGQYDYVIMYLDVMGRYGTTKQQDMVLHELGHGEGLAHAPCTNSNSVMVTGCPSSIGHPGKHDKADIKDLWVTGDGPGSFPTTAEEDPSITQTPDGYRIDDYAN